LYKNQVDSAAFPAPEKVSQYGGSTLDGGSTLAKKFLIIKSYRTERSFAADSLAIFTIPFTHRVA